MAFEFPLLDTRAAVRVRDSEVQMNAVALRVIASNWRAFAKNTLQGFVDLEVPESGLVIRGV